MGSSKHVAVEGEHRLLITRVVLIATVFAGQEPFPARFVEAFCEVAAEKRETQDGEAGCLARLESHAETAHLSLTLAISGWVAGGFGEAVEERAWDCCHVLGVRGR